MRLWVESDYQESEKKIFISYLSCLSYGSALLGMRDIINRVEPINKRTDIISSDLSLSLPTFTYKDDITRSVQPRLKSLQIRL